MKNTNVSIVLITWAPNARRLKLLEQTVQRLRECTYEPYTLIMVDNGPADQTAVIRSMDPDVHIVNKVNVGPGAARNQGAAVARTPYVAFVDNDLWFYRDWLADSLVALRRFPGQIAHPARSNPMRRSANFIETLADGYERWAMVAGWCWVMEKATFAEVGDFRTSDVEPVEDREWANRARNKGHMFIWPPGGFVRHRHGPKGFPKDQRLIDGQWLPVAKTFQESNP